MRCGLALRYGHASDNTSTAFPIHGSLETVNQKEN